MYDFHYRLTKNTLILNCYLRLLTETVLLMKNVLGTNTCLILVTIPKHSTFFAPTNKKVIGKIKDVSEGKNN